MVEDYKVSWHNIVFFFSVYKMKFPIFFSREQLPRWESNNNNNNFNNTFSGNVDGRKKLLQRAEILRGLRNNS